MNENKELAVGLKVRTTIGLGPHLPQGSVGIIISDDSALYPNSADDQCVLAVAFRGLGIPVGQTYKDDKIDPKSVPHYNVVAMRRKDVEIV